MSYLALTPEDKEQIEIALEILRLKYLLQIFFNYPEDSVMHNNIKQEIQNIVTQIGIERVQQFLLGGKNNV